ncbi:hypothetical protein QBC38DRAFT_461158 [Podospora fimiseda]|uniref:Rhodopsin domain-containing protein n=1 Tax=Podospora fimiseda TaxID=252190 RepID=A0AAN6YM09_9PEZI|nr:hypothetical protein QBC38DRAFT_461158 [Podospora fimiseda]
MSSTDQRPPGYAEEDHGHWIIIPNTLFTIICPILFGLRMWARHTTTGLDLGDWVGLSALIFTLITNALFFAMVFHGFGKHSDILPYDQLKSALRLWWLAQQTYKFALHLTKISLLLLYIRIFNHVIWFRKVALSLIIFLILYMIAASAAGFAQCTPVAKSWDRFVDGKCVDLYVLFNTNGVIAMVTDVIILLLPFPLVFKLSLPWQQKLALMPVFGLGAIICVSSALRVYTLVTATTRDADRSYDISATMWTIVEYNLALVCLCLPSVRVLLVKGFPEYFKSAASRSGRSSNNVVRSVNGVGTGTWRSGVRSNGGSGGWSRVERDNSGKSSRARGLEENDSQEVILDSFDGEERDVESGRGTGGGIKKTVKYEVEFEMVEPAKAKARD